MREVIVVGVLLAVAAALAWLRPLSDRVAPSPLPAESCDTWMADAIPGIGPKTRDQTAAAIRAGRIPPKAAGWFSTGAP